MSKLVRSETIPLWERNHSKQRLIEEEMEDYASYQLGYCMKKEVQNPSLSTYLNFSSELYPIGNVCEFEFDWLGEPLCFMADFNRGTMAWALGQRQMIDGQMKEVVLWEKIGKNVTTKQHAKEVGQWILDEGHTFVELYGDATANQGGKKGYGRWGTNDWKDVTDTFDALGIRWRKNVGKSNPKRNERIRQVRNRIWSEVEGVEVRNLLIHSRCQDIIDDYLFSIRDGDELKKKNQGERGHISDAVDYWLVKLGKERRKINIIR